MCLMKKTMSELLRAAFELANESAYRQWSSEKSRLPLPTVERLRVKVADPYRLTAAERTALLERCELYNMALYQLSDASSSDKSLVHSLGAQLGLVQLDANLRSDEDSISSLQVRSQEGNQYIPYTNKALSWHTDGYYNKPGRQINAIIMHCVSPAEEGGGNQLLDPEQVYWRLRDENPAFIEALMHPGAMTIPANIEAGREIRAAQSGPVFSLHAPSGRLHMRYSARKRNIIWRDDAMTQAAVSRITAMLADESLTLSVRLRPGQGIICNNVLHNRSRFNDSARQQRLVYRARYFDRVEPVLGCQRI